MKEIGEILKILAEVPFEGQVGIIVLAAFGLAAYAIYAVLKVTRERR